MLVAFFNEFEKIYEALPDTNFIKEYRDRSFLIGKNITFIKGEEEISALVKDIDDSGSLVVIKENGEEQTLSTGEVNIKKDEKFFGILNNE